MKLFVLYGLWLVSTLAGPVVTLAQSSKVDVYQAQVLTKNGGRYKGVLDEVTESSVYLSDSPDNGRFRRQPIPLDDIRKVTVRRVNQTPVLITGAVLGALLTGYLTSRSLANRPLRSPLTYGLTLTFGAFGGAAGGLVVGSAVSHVRRRVVRPLGNGDPAISLFRQLELYSVRYQQAILNRVQPTIP